MKVTREEAILFIKKEIASLNRRGVLLRNKIEFYQQNKQYSVVCIFTELESENNQAIRTLKSLI
jgi:hypothetical protein